MGCASLVGLPMVILTVHCSSLTTHHSLLNLNLISWQLAMGIHSTLTSFFVKMVDYISKMHYICAIIETKYYAFS